MSIRFEPKEEDCELSEDGKEIEIYIGNDYNGNTYVDLDINIVKKLLKEAK